MHPPACARSIKIPQELLDKAKGVVGVMTAKKLDNHMALVHYQVGISELGEGQHAKGVWQVFTRAAARHAAVRVLMALCKSGLSTLPLSDMTLLLFR